MLCTSTMGDSPVTVMVSVSSPTRRSMLMVAVKDPSRATPSRLTVEKPDSENVTVYDPARRSTIRYCPLPSVVAVRTFSISAGLDASTVTPGSTAPDVSRTVPVMDACAKALGAAARNPARTRDTAPGMRMTLLRRAGPFRTRHLCEWLETARLLQEFDESTHKKPSRTKVDPLEKRARIRR